jgi:LAS superfamily LD-carboxypeptidase LdcB
MTPWPLIGRLAAIVAVATTVTTVAYTAHGAVHPSERARAQAPAAARPTGEAPTGTGEVRHLDPALYHAFVVAQRDAATAGVDLRITSGWRSHAEQAALFAAAVQKYGSAAAASHWVLPAGQSDHERGLAIDVGPPAGAAWLDVHGVHYGLCRRYANEPWHFELLAPALGQQCPAMKPYA